MKNSSSKQSLPEFVVWCFPLMLFVGCGDQASFKMNSRTMQPAIPMGDHYQVNRIDNSTPIRRFDVVQYSQIDNTTAVGRVIGLPGETVAFENGRVTIHGTPINVPSSIVVAARPKTALTTINYPLKIQENEYFIIGDNQPISYDSYQLGSIKGSSIVGRVQR